MREFLYDMLIEPFEDGFGGWILAIISWSMTILVVGLVSYGVYYGLDYCWLRDKEAVCVYENKYIIEEHTTTTYIMSGKVMLPVINHFPREYKVVFRVNNDLDSYNTSSKRYSEIKKEDAFYCRYSKGRISSKLYIKEVYFQRKAWVN